MDRVPCRVSADLRRHQRELDERQRFAPNEKRVQQAREEIIDAIMTGHGWRGHVLAAVLEEYTNVTPPILYDRFAEIATRLKFLACKRDDELILLRADTDAWLRGLVTTYIRDQWVEDRAAELACEDTIPGDDPE
jgi:hypothetical protein